MKLFYLKVHSTLKGGWFNLIYKRQTVFYKKYGLWDILNSNIALPVSTVKFYRCEVLQTSHLVHTNPCVIVRGKNILFSTY